MHQTPHPHSPRETVLPRSSHPPGFLSRRRGVSSGILLLAALFVLGGSSRAGENGFHLDEAPPLPERVNRIAIGSCARQNLPQPIWEPIVAAEPDLFLFLGDNVYADTADAGEMKAAYRMLAAQPGFRRLRRACPILAIWDDHDYGANDAGKEFPAKALSEAIFHEFFETPADSEARGRPGIYRSVMMGNAGHRLQILLLDTRYFRDPLIALPTRHRDGRYERNRDPGATLLGEAQWDWLKEQLGEPADFRIIASSIQVLPQEHRWELWENFPLERARLLGLLGTHASRPVLFVSGDRHMGEIMKLPPEDPLAPGFPVYELTSSGLTHAGGGRKNEPNRHRVSSTNVQERNFGLIEIGWESREVKLELRGVDGRTIESYSFAF